MKNNPLVGKKVAHRSISWQEFVSRFDEATDLMELFHLLHFGFSSWVSVRGYRQKEFSRNEAGDRVIWYLERARCHSCFRKLENPEDQLHEMETPFGRVGGQAGVKKMLAQKALKELCLHVFRTKEGLRDGRLPDWTPDICGDVRVLNAVFDFFEVDGEGGRQDNIPRSLGDTNREEVIVREFLIDLAYLAWDLGRLSDPYYKKSREVLRKARPRIVRVLDRLNELKVMYKRPFVLDIDGSTMAALKNLAMGTMFRAPRAEERPVESIEEALGEGSLAALIFVYYRHILRNEKTKQREDRLWLQDMRRRQKENERRETERQYREAKEKLGIA